MFCLVYIYMYCGGGVLNLCAGCFWRVIQWACSEICGDFSQVHEATAGMLASQSDYRQTSVDDVRTYCKSVAVSGH